MELDGSVETHSNIGTPSNSEENSVRHLVSPERIQYLGLLLVGYKKKRLKKSTKAVNFERFIGFYGLSPVTVADVYHDMQTTDNDEAKVNGSRLDLKGLLMAINYLWKYPTLHDMEARFGYCKYWNSEKVWGFIKKLRALKHEKIRWEEDLCRDDIWVLTVDGIHCSIREPKHPVWSQNRRYYSHKYGKAGLMYELGICLSTSRLLWIRGPYPAGTSDITVAKNQGLVEELRRRGQKAIGDRGYNGAPKQISTPNAHDNKGVDLFKRRALMRHEGFNGLIKRFDVTNTCFRHSHDKFELAFEAVCVLCQYKVEIENPLYDILIDQVVEAYGEGSPTRSSAYSLV